MDNYSGHKIVIFLFSFLMVVSGVMGCSKNQNKSQSAVVKEIIYAGTFEGDGSKGLYVFAFNRKTQKLTKIQTVSDRKGPNFQAIDPTGHYLYSVSGQAFTDSVKKGTVSAYRIDRKTGKLTLINEQSVEGRGPAHVSVAPKGKFVYVSNYGSGSLSVFKIKEDGSLTKAVDVVQHEGSSINEKRQQAPHVHSIIPSPDGQFIYVSDLGLDKIMIYKVDPETGEFTPAETPYFESTPGAGPRHFVIHPNGKFAYSVEELSATVSVLKIDPSTVALTQIQRISTIPEDFKENNFPADIHISPDGQFLYVSNRGHNSLVIYKISKTTGKLSLVGYQPVKGKRPRSFMIDQKGGYVFVANLRSNNIAIFKRNKTTGKLMYTGNQVKVPKAVCLTQLILD